MIRIGASIGLVIALVVSATFFERRAIACGEGIVGRSLPYGLRADWFNGGLWLTDAEGWAVVAPSWRLETKNGPALEVARIARITSDRELVIDVRLRSGERVHLSFAGSTSNARVVQRLLPDQIPQDAVWDSVDGASCFYGHFWFLRCAAAAGIGLAGIGLWRSVQGRPLA